jgi:hypothetical protein
MMHTFPILALGFLAPWLMAAGAAATSIPIVIHLLNKRKFRVIVWAAMDFLLAAQKRNARRLRFQRWLLLAVRCLALLVIAAGIAQLILQSKTFGEFLGEQRAVLLLWDDSYSTAFQSPAANAGTADRTAFERGRRLLTEYVQKAKPSDKLLLLRTSRLASGAGGAEVKPTTDHDLILSQLRAAAPSDAATDLPTAFEQAAAILKDLESSTRTRQVVLVTDFSNSSIHDPSTPGNRGATGRPQTSGGGSLGLSGDRLKKAADGLRAHATEFRVRGVGDPAQVNMAVTDLRPRRPAVVANAPADVDVTVFNATNTPQIDVPLTLLLDGVVAASEKLPKIDPGATLITTARVNIPSVGRHLIEARLPGDLLPVDDSRRLLVNARREIPILLVDGNPGDGRASYGSAAYLWAAYAFPADNKPASAFAPKIITELDLPTTPLATYDVAILSDTADPPPAVRENLRKFVDAGGLLMIFPGPRTNAQRMNEALGDAGARLLPAVLGQPVKLEGADQVAAGITFAPEGYAHPVLSVFAPDYKAGKEVGFATVQTTQYLKLGIAGGGTGNAAPKAADEGVETIVRYANANGTPGDPAVVLKSFGAGKGKVVLFASSADMAWNTWGAKPSYLPFVHELTYYAMNRELASALTLRLGDRLHLPATAAAAGAWTGPRDTRVNVSSELDKDGRAFLTSPPLTLAGTYTPPPTAGAADGRPAAAVNPDAEEADIRYVPAAQMAATLGLDPALVTEGSTALAAAAVQSPQDGAGLLGPGLVGAALGLFLLETVLAMLFSTYR